MRSKATRGVIAIAIAIFGAGCGPAVGVPQQSEEGRSTTAAGTSAGPPPTLSPGDASVSTHAGHESSESGEADATSLATTRAGEPVACGDGQVSADESCDDGNRIDGDGCNIDCERSGTPLWATAPLRDGLYRRVLFTGNDAELVVIRSGLNEPSPTLVGFGRDGQQQWDTTFSAETFADFDTHADGNIALYTVASTQTTQLDHRLRTLAPAGDAIWEFSEFSGRLPTEVTFVGNSLITVASLSYGSGRNATGTPLWSREGIRGVRAAGEGSFYAQVDDRLSQVSVAGDDIWSTSISCTGPAAVAPHTGAYWRAASRAGDDGALELCVVDPDGGVVNTTPLTVGQANAQVFGLALDGLGGIVLALRRGNTTTYEVEKHHPEVGLVHTTAIAHYQDLAVDAWTGRIAIASDSLEVVRP